MVLTRLQIAALLIAAGSAALAAAADGATQADLEWMRHPHPAQAIGSPAATPAPPIDATLEWMRHPHPATPIPTPYLPSVAPAPREGFHSEDRIAGSEAEYAEDPAEANQSDGSDQDDPATEDSGLAAAIARSYVVNTVPAETLAFTPPALPDLSGYTAAAARARIKRRPRGQISVHSMLGEVTFKGFMGRDGRLREWASRQFSLPKAIIISGGYVTPKDLARALPAQFFAETAKGVFVARLPIDIRPGATLHIGDEVKAFRLSQDRGAFLANEGTLFITGTTFEAWNEAHDRPAEFHDKHEFRPFLISWGGSDTYIVGSKVGYLGYAASKSYGIAISQFSPALKRILHRPEPTGWILDSEFYGNWYGFYCYEADGVVVRNNVYHDNIKYGIDPHDRSRHLIIAGNEIYGTKEKHGIIISREVDDSWIFDNKSHDNALSGIVIDRNSVNNVIAGNESYRNRSDGITIYESPNLLLWKNVSTANGRHGIRVRNSTDIRLYDNVAVGNNLAGIYGDVKDLTGTDRNLRLDPFHQRVSMVVVGGALVSNGSGPVSIDQPLSLELYNVDLRAPRRELGFKFTGVLGTYQDQVLDILVRQHKAVAIHPAEATTSASK